MFTALPYKVCWYNSDSSLVTFLRQIPDAIETVDWCVNFFFPFHMFLLTNARKTIPRLTKANDKLPDSVFRVNWKSQDTNTWLSKKFILENGFDVVPHRKHFQPSASLLATANKGRTHRKFPVEQPVRRAFELDWENSWVGTTCICLSFTPAPSLPFFLKCSLEQPNLHLSLATKNPPRKRQNKVFGVFLFLFS